MDLFQVVFEFELSGLLQNRITTAASQRALSVLVLLFDRFLAFLDFLDFFDLLAFLDDFFGDFLGEVCFFGDALLGLLVCFLEAVFLELFGFDLGDVEISTASSFLGDAFLTGEDEIVAIILHHFGDGLAGEEVVAEINGPQWAKPFTMLMVPTLHGVAFAILLLGTVLLRDEFGIQRDNPGMARRHDRRR